VVYIFGGVDFPVFEFLFIISIVLLIGLIIMIIAILSTLKELKTLKSLLIEEETDIKEFEADIEKLKKFDGKENEDTDKVKKYIKDAMDKGFSSEQIKKSLIAQGWVESKVDDIIKDIISARPTSPKERV